MAGRVLQPWRRHPNPLAVDEMIESIFAQGPLTDLINNAAGNFISRTRSFARASMRCQHRHAWHFYVTHAVGRRWIAGKHRATSYRSRDLVCTAAPMWCPRP